MAWTTSLVVMVQQRAPQTLWTIASLWSLAIFGKCGFVNVSCCIVLLHVGSVSDACVHGDWAAMVDCKHNCFM